MRALWLEKQTLRIRNDIPVPVIPEGEALVRMRLAGICSTDLEMLRGYYSFSGVPGHEFIGEVVQIHADAEEKQWLGKRVAGEINISCGTCEACRKIDPRHCERRTTLGMTDRNGVFSEYFSLPLRNLHAVPDAVSDEAAVFTEPLAAAFEIIEQVAIGPGEKVLLVGAGRLGQLTAQVLALTGCELIVLARHQKQIALLEQRGIRTISEENIQAKHWDIVVEATGSIAGFNLARMAVRPRGVIVLKSTYKGEEPVNFSSLVVNEITLIGSRCGPFPLALQALVEKRIDPIPLIEASYELERGLEAMAHAGKPGVMKVLFHP